MELGQISAGEKAVYLFEGTLMDIPTPSYCFHVLTAVLRSRSWGICLAEVALG